MPVYSWLTRQQADAGRDIVGREDVVAGAGTLGGGSRDLDRVGAAGRQREPAIVAIAPELAARGRRQRVAARVEQRDLAPVEIRRDAGFVPPPPGLSWIVIDSPAVP